MASVQIRYNWDTRGKPVSMTVQIYPVSSREKGRSECKTFRYDEAPNKDTAEQETYLKTLNWIRKWFQDHPEVKRTPSSMEVLLLKIMDIEL